jgi:hypothetical protein
MDRMGKPEKHNLRFVLDELPEWKPDFPRLDNSSHHITSEPTVDYNCIAWAASSSDDWWWPDPNYTSFWPENIERKETIEIFIEAFSMLGYEICESRLIEEGFEKVCIYLDVTNKPTHMARQLPNGNWTSKLGNGHDIEHYNLEAINGTLYGEAQIFLKRSKS